MSIALTPPQVAEKSILDYYNRQTYLGNQFIYSINNTSIGSTSETPILLLSNPSTDKVSLFHGLRKLTSLTAGQSAVFRFYTGATISSAGTPVTPINLKTGSTALSQAAVTVNPTASSFGTFIALLASESFVPNASDLLFIIDPGFSMLVTVQVSLAATMVASELSWYEL